MLIGELSERSGISRRMLRHYDELGLVTPSARSTVGYREYSDADLRRLLDVESLRSLGLTLAEVANALDDPAHDVGAVITQLVADAERRIAREQELLGRLRSVADRAPGSWSDVLEVVGLINALRSEEPRTRHRAALASASSAHAEIDDLVDAQLSEPELNVAGALEWAIARGGEGAVELLRGGAESGDAEVRGNAVRALAQIEGMTATAALAEFLDDVDPAVRGRAALETGRRGVTAAADELVTMVVEGRGDVEAAEVLGAMAVAEGREREFTRDVVAELESGRPVGEQSSGEAHSDTAHRSEPAVRRPEPAVRRRITQALAELPGPNAVQALADLESDDDPQVALTAKSVRLARAQRGTGRAR